MHKRHIVKKDIKRIKRKLERSENIIKSRRPSFATPGVRTSSSTPSLNVTATPGFNMETTTKLMEFARDKDDKKETAVKFQMGGLTEGSTPEAWTGGELNSKWNRLAKLPNIDYVPKPTQIRSNSSKGAEALSKRTAGLAESEKYRLQLI